MSNADIKNLDIGSNFMRTEGVYDAPAKLAPLVQPQSRTTSSNTQDRRNLTVPSSQQQVFLGLADVKNTNEFLSPLNLVSPSDMKPAPSTSMVASSHMKRSSALFKPQQQRRVADLLEMQNQ